MSASSGVRHTVVVAAGSAEEARDLARLLARHGISGQVAGDDVEVLSGRERMNSVLADLAVALARWLADRQRQSISVTAGGRRLRLDRSGRYTVERPYPLAS